MKNILILLIMFPALLAAQTASVSLDECLSKALEKWPGSSGAKNAMETGQLKQRNAQNTWYPQVSIGGQASWQSDVTSVSLPIPGMSLPDIPKDQYKIYLDVNQVLYDGGISSSRTKMEMVSAYSDSVQTVIDSRKIKETVIDLYCNIIYFRKVKELSQAQLERLNKRLTSMQSSNSNGVLSGTDYLLFSAEVKKTEQNLTDAEMTELSMLRSLSILTGMELNPETLLIRPSSEKSLSAEYNRPEFSFFSLQNDLITLSQQASGKTLRPRLSAFAQGGYGRPALNMFSTDFDNYFMAGLRLNWNLYDWGQSKREKQIYEIRKKSITISEENLRQNIDIQINQQEMEMEKLEKQLKKDDEIIEIYNTVIKNSTVALEQGVITPVDYLEKETLLKVAGIDKARDEARYIRAYTLHRFIKGEI
jgi:outer membrane protein TolC